MINKQVNRHILFWALYIIFTVGIYNVKEPALGIHLTYELASLPAKMFLVYFTLYFTLPHYLLQRKYVPAVLQFSLALVLSVWLLHVGLSFILYPMYYPEIQIALIPKSLTKMVSPLLDLIIVSSLAVVIKLLKDREQQERGLLELEKINAQNELQLLKSQLHPHFLFNTLNGLYAHIMENPQLASNMVVKLSDLLRFIIYEGSKPLVQLKDDLECLKNYIGIERIRYGEKLSMEFTISGETSEKKIVPLLLLPFMENAFKHGPAKEYDKCWIRSQIQIEEHYITLTLKNFKGSHKDTNIDQSGIGLYNVKQRLIYYYKDQFELNIEDHADQFWIFLKIPLVVS